MWLLGSERVILWAIIEGFCWPWKDGSTTLSRLSAQCHIWKYNHCQNKKSEPSAEANLFFKNVFQPQPNSLDEKQKKQPSNIQPVVSICHPSPPQLQQPPPQSSLLTCLEFPEKERRWAQVTNWGKVLMGLKVGYRLAHMNLTWEGAGGPHTWFWCKMWTEMRGLPSL